MIPKIIHYCWFGGNPLPKLAKKCIRSWKKYCKGYEIRQWNEGNFDIFTAPLYVRQAYEAKKWAFVADYVRLYAMTTFGGIYMDTDVELVAPLDDFLHHHAFAGFESDPYISTGILACEKNFPLFQEFLRFYGDTPFLNPDGSFNQTTNVVTITRICLERGLVPNGEYQEVEGFALYPREVFCPLNYENGKLDRTSNTAAIHWFDGSWLPKEVQASFAHRKKQRKKAERKEFFRYLPNRILLTLLGEKRYSKLKDKHQKR